MHVQKLTPRIWLYTPEAPAPGQLVILCSWADARQQHIARYIQLHNTIAPGASILLIQTPATILVSPYAWQRAALKPAVQYVIEKVLRRPEILNVEEVSEEQQGQQEQEQEQEQETTAGMDTDVPKILFHSLSNGGSLTATQLLTLLREATHAPLPLVGLIMDSSPDGGTYRQTHSAIVVAQPPSTLRRAVVALMAHAALLPVWSLYVVGQQENSQLIMRRTLLDRSFVGTSNICYVYSKDDKITRWEDVHLHAEEARMKGWSVEEHRLEGSSHCAHIRTNEKLYADVVDRLWNGVNRQSKL